MRVLIVSHGHPELGAGGAERAAYSLFRGLRRQQGIRPRFLAWSKPAGDARETPHIAPFAGRPDEFLLSAESLDDFLLSQRSPPVIAAFLSLLDDLEPQVIHFHHYLNIGLEIIAAARRAKPEIRIVVTLHEYRAICHHHGQMVKTQDYTLCEAADSSACAACFDDRDPADFARRRAFIQAHFQSVDLFVAPSTFLRDRYIAWGLPAARIAVQDNGVAQAKSSPRSARPGQSHGVFGFFGQINPFKGLHVLLAAFDRFRRMSGADGRLFIHGAGLEDNHPDYVAGFRGALAATAGPVDFAGPYEHADLPALMGAVDWVVVPSIWWENSPLVIQEAFAHRRPVICAGIGGMAEKVRPGLDGFHFRAGSHDALAAVMAEVAADGRIWDRLQSTLAQPATIDQAVAGHLALYRP